MRKSKFQGVETKVGESEKASQNSENISESEGGYYFNEGEEAIMYSSQGNPEPDEFNENDSLIEAPINRTISPSPLSGLKKSGFASKKYEIYHSYDFGRGMAQLNEEEKGLNPKYEKSIIKRKFQNRLNVRYCCAFFIPLVLIGIILALYQASRSQDEFSYPINDNTKVFIEMNRCLLYLNEQMQDNDEVFGYYYLSYGLGAIFNSDEQQPSFSSNFDSNKNELNISVLSYNQNTRSCNIHLHMPSAINVANLAVVCHTSCLIVQEYNVLKAQSLEINAESEINANFRRIEVGQLLFAAEKGLLQVNSFLIKNKANINLTNGDVILQSENDILLDWQNEQQTFCFASPSVKHQSIQDCALAEDPTTASKSTLTTCKGKTSICSNPTCGQMPTIAITQKVGNLYANRITNPYEDINYVKNYQISNGAIYTQGVSFEPNSMSAINTAREKAAESDTDQIFILEMGKKTLQSRRNGLWTIISNPSYAYIRPWWLSTFSLSLLTAQSYEVSGYLSPGFCPYHIEANLQEVYGTQVYLSNYFNLNTSVISYVNTDLDNNPSMEYQNGTGFFDFIKGRPTNENWISVEIDQEGQLNVVNNDIDKNQFILVALILSFLFAAFVGMTMLYIFKTAVMLTYKEILEKSRHCKYYINYINPSDKGSEQKKEQKKFNLQGILEETSFQNFIREVPRLSAFIGFYSSNLMKKYMIDSVDEFLSFLMNPHLEHEIIKANKGISELKYIKMKEKTLKNYYEKFCFLNGLTEKQMSDDENIKKFNNYGFELIDDTENLSKAFTMMQLRDDSSVVPDLTMNCENSLDLFIETYVKNTKCDTDTEFVDEVIERYEHFCSKYRLVRCDVRPDKMASDIKYKFGLTNIPRKKLVRMSLSHLEKESSQKPGFFESAKIFFLKMVTFNNYVEKKSLKNKFLIDEEQLKYHFIVILNPNERKTYENLDAKGEEGKNEKIVTRNDVINKMIYHSYWYYWFAMDASTILLHQLITAVCVMPFLFLTLLMEISYSPYSIIDPDYLITMSDFNETPWQILGKIGNFTAWNIIIISICIFFMVYSFFDCLLYFYYTEFPEDQTFENHQKVLKKSIFLKTLSNLQWLLIFFVVFCYTSYTGLVCVWLLLGAIINPNNFLVYSTAALTFLTFLMTKYQAFQEIAEKGFKIIRIEVFKIMQLQIKKIIGVMIEEEKENAIQIKGPKYEINKFSYAKAEEFNLDEEIRSLKNFNLKSLEVGATKKEKNENNENDPESTIEKLKQTEEKFKEKAIEIFRMKCQCLGVKKELVELVLNINFKQTKELKENLANLIESQSKKILDQQLNGKLIKTILNVMILPDDVKNYNDLSIIISKELVTELMQYFVSKSLIIDVSEDYSKHEELFFTSFSLIETLKKKDKKNFIKIIKNMMKMLTKNDPQIEVLTKLLDIIDIIMAMKNEAQFKRRIMDYYERNIHDPDLLELLRVVTFSSPDEQIIEIGSKIYERSENLTHILKNLNKRIKIQDIQDKELSIQSSEKKQEDFHYKMIKNFIGFAIKMIKCHNIPKETGKFIKKSTKFLEKMAGKHLPQGEIEKLVNVAPAFIHFGKDVKSFWNKISQKYCFDIDHIRDIIFLISKDYYHHFGLNRMAYLENSPIIEIISNKIHMSQFELLGFIAFFYDDYEYKYVHDFLNGLCDYEKRVLPDLFKRRAKLIIKLLFLKQSPFSAYSLLSQLGVSKDQIKDFFKDLEPNDENLEILYKIGLFDNKDQIKIDIEEGKETEKYELDSKAVFKVTGMQDQEEQIEDFLNILKNVFSVKLIPKTSPKRNIEIKNKIGEFAERFNYDQQGLEYLMFILMADYHNVLNGFKYFLDDQPDFQYQQKIFQQIVKTILKEDIRNLQNPDFYVNWLPADHKIINFKDFIAKSFQIFPWSGVDSLDFVCELSSYAMESLEKEEGLNLEKELKEMKNRLFLLFHIQELEPEIIVSLFPFLKNVEEDDDEAKVLHKISYHQKEEPFSEMRNPIQKLTKLKNEEESRKHDKKFQETSESLDLEKIQIERMGQEKKKEFKENFTEITKLIINKKISIKDLYELIQKHFFHNEANIIKIGGLSPKINWEKSENIKKYVFFFSFMNNSFCTHMGSSLEKQENKENKGFIDHVMSTYIEIRNYYSLHFSPDDGKTHFDFDEFNRLIRYYFTTDPEVFVQGIIPNLKYFHGRANELIGILSISTETPNVELLSNVLNCKTYEIDSLLSLCDYYTQTFEESINIFQNNDKWFRKLSIDVNEFIFIVKFLYNMIDPFDYPKFINMFGLDSYIDNKVLQSIFCIYAQTENFKDELETYMKISKERKVIFEAIGVNPTLGDLFCEINAGNFWNIRKVVQSNRMLSDIKIFPERNAQNLVETISAFIGMINTDTRLDIEMIDLYWKFSLKSMKMGNNLESVAYLMYQHFQISPLMFFLSLDLEFEELKSEENENEIIFIDISPSHKSKAKKKTTSKAISFVENLKKQRVTQLKPIFQALQEMTLAEKNKIVQCEFIYQLSNKTIEEGSDKKEGNFFYEITGRKISEKESQKDEIPPIPQELNDYKFSLKTISKKFEDKLTEIYNDSEECKGLSNDLKFISKKNNEIYFMIKDFYARISRLGAPNDVKDNFYPEKNPITCLVMLSLLRDLRKLVKKKDELNKNFEKKKKNLKNKTIIEESKGLKRKTAKSELEKKIRDEENESKMENYKLMIDFALTFDLLLTCMEKIKMIDEEYKNFYSFDKNAMLKFLVPMFFPNCFYVQDDFILEYFFRNSLFEDEVLKEVTEQIELLKDSQLSIPKKLAKILLSSKVLSFYFASPELEANIDYLQDNWETIRTYEELRKNLDEKKNKIIFPEPRRKFLDVLIEYKDKRNADYKLYKFSAFEALEDYYPPEECHKNANLEAIQKENKRFESKQASTFFSDENFKNLESFPLFNKHCSFTQSQTLTEQLNRNFRDIQMLKTDSAKNIFTNLIVILKEEDVDSKKKEEAFDYVLAKISFNMRSNFNNLKLFLDILMKKDIDEEKYDACLKKLDINPDIFYGLFILHFDIVKETSKIKTKCPRFLEKIIGNDLTSNMRNSCIRKLFTAKIYTEIQKDYLVLLVNSFVGDQTSWKKLLYDLFYMKLIKNITTEPSTKKIEKQELNKEITLNVFVEFLELINLFDKRARKPYKDAILNFISLSELLSPYLPSFEDFNSELFKHRIQGLTDLDNNNLTLIRAIVQPNYTILLRMFNEVPLFISRKLNFHHNSHRFFSIKLLLLFADMGESSNVNPNVIDYLLYQVNPKKKQPQKKDEIIKKIIGIDYDFFNLICATNSGDFSKFLGYLAFKDEKFLILVSLYCWIYAPFISHLYKVSTNESIKKRIEISKLMMYGIFHVFQALNKELLLSHKLVIDLKKELQNDILETLQKFCQEIVDRPIYNIDWFSFPISNFMDVLNQDFSFYLKEKKYPKEFYEEIKNLFGTDLNNFIKNFEDYFSNFSENKGNNYLYLNLLKKLFMPYFYGTSGLDSLNNEIIDKLLHDILNEDNILEKFLNMHRKGTKKIGISSMVKAKDNLKIYNGIIKLSLVGFHIIGKMRNDKHSKAEEFLKKILENFAGKDDFFISSVIDWVIFVFNDEPVVPEDEIKKFFVNILAQIYIEIIGKEEVPNAIKKIEEEKTRLKEEYSDVLAWEKSLKEYEEEDTKKLAFIKESEETKGLRLITEKILKETRNPELIFILIEEVIKYIQQYPYNSLYVKNQQLQRIAIKLGEIIFPIDNSAQQLFESILYLTKGDIDKMGDEMLNILSIDKKSTKKLKQLLQDFGSIVELPQNFVAGKINIYKESLNQDFTELDDLQEKIQNKELDPKDLFTAFDTDRSGKISLEEFKLLTKRLNMNLSEHRIREIFTSVKGEESSYSQELNEKEFELALNYLQEKSIMLTLEFLGITKEILFGILIWLTFLLLILFGFIFAGIAAFTIAGTFGSIINSMFPIAGGVGLSKKGEDKESALDMEKVQAKVEKCVEIIQSVKI